MNLLSFFTKFCTSQRCGRIEWSENVRIMSQVFPVPLFILYLVLHFSEDVEVWNCLTKKKSQDNVTLFPSPEPLVTL